MNLKTAYQILAEAERQSTRPEALGLYTVSGDDGIETLDVDSRLYRADWDRARLNDLRKAKGLPKLKPSKVRLAFEKRRRLRVMKAAEVVLAHVQKSIDEFQPQLHAYERLEVELRTRMQPGVHDYADLAEIREDRENLADVQVLLPTWRNRFFTLDQDKRRALKFGGQSAVEAVKRRQTQITAELAARQAEKDSIDKRLATRERELKEYDQVEQELTEQIGGDLFGVESPKRKRVPAGAVPEVLPGILEVEEP